MHVSLHSSLIEALIKYCVVITCSGSTHTYICTHVYMVGWNLNYKCRVVLTQARHPLMPDDSMAELLRRHLKGTLPEDLWKEVVQGFCKPKVLPLPGLLPSA